MDIAYLCDLDPRLGWTYSGGNRRIFEALEAQGARLRVLDPGWGLAEPLRRVLTRAPEKVNLRLRWRVHLALGRVAARAVSRQLRKTPPDVVFCAYSIQSLSGLRVPDGVKLVFTSDATNSVYKRSAVGAAFGSSRMARWTDPLVLRAETRILRACDLLLWPSVWQSEAATALHDLDPRKARVLPWGANLPDPGTGGPRPGMSGGLRLLMVGRDWTAKGGWLVHEVLAELHRRGVPAALDVIGGVPDEGAYGEGVTAHGQIDKSAPGGLAAFETIFRGTHFLVQPSFESYGFAFCEAAAYGVPSLGLREGGVPIREAVNGHAFAAGTPATAYADVLERYWRAPKDWEALSLSSRAYYENALNWTAWGRAAMAEMTEMMR